MDLITPMSSFVSGPPPAVVPVLVGPMYALFAILPAIAIAIARATWQLLGPKGLWRTAQMAWRQKLPLAGIAAAVAGLVYVWPYVFPTAIANSSNSKAEAAADWPFFRGSLDRRACEAGTAQDPDHGKKVWDYVHKDISTVFSSPALRGNRVYIAMAFYGYYRDKGAICCLDADTGGLLWAYDQGYRSTFSSPVVKDKYLVVGEGLHETKDARVFCLDAKASEEQHRGVKLWEYRTKSHVEASPCIFDDKVVIGAGDDGVYCFALEPEASGNAHVVWHLDGKNYPDCETSPVYLDGKLYWGLGRYGGEAVVCVDANSGQEIWRVKTPSPVVGSPAIANGRLCVGMGFGDFVNSGDRVAVTLPQKMRDRGKTEEQIKEAVANVKREGEVWCISLADHQVLWKFSAGQVVLATPAVDGNEVYAASRDGRLYCLAAADGKPIRSYDFHEPLLASPAVGKEHVYVVTGTGRVCGLDKDRLVPVWDVPMNVASFSSPAVGRGHLYVGTASGGLWCMGQPAEPWRRTPVWPGELGGAGKGGWDDSILPENSDYAWGFSGSDSNQTAEFAKGLKAPAARIGAGIYVGIGKGLAKLLCGKSLAAMPKEQWLAKSDNPVTLSAFGSERSIFFVDGKAGDSGRFLHCVDPNSGAELWHRPVEKDASGASVVTWDPAAIGRRWKQAVESNTTAGFVFTWDRLLIAESRKGLSCLDTGDPAEPREVWKADLGPTVGAPCLLSGGLAMVAVEDPPKIMAVDANSGVAAWELPLSRPPTSGPVVAGPRVWVADAQGLVGAWMPQAGDPPSAKKEDVWTIPCGPLRPTLAASGFWIACVTQDGEQLLLDAGAGTVVAKLGKVVGDIPPVLTDNEVLYLAKGSIQRYDLRTGKSTLWTKMTSWGNVLTPMIVSNSYVVFATDEEGLVCMKPRK